MIRQPAALTSLAAFALGLASTLPLAAQLTPVGPRVTLFTTADTSPLLRLAPAGFGYVLGFENTLYYLGDAGHVLSSHALDGSHVAYYSATPVGIRGGGFYLALGWERWVPGGPLGMERWNKVVGRKYSPEGVLLGEVDLSDLWVVQGPDDPSIAFVGRNSSTRAGGSFGYGWRAEGYHIVRFDSDADQLDAEALQIPNFQRMAVANDGSFATVDTDNTDSDVYLTLFDAAGTQLSHRILSQEAAGDQDSPNIAARADGSWIAMWSHQVSSSPIQVRLMFRIFNGDGTPRTGDLPVTEGSAPWGGGYEEDGTFVIGAGGNMLFVWGNRDGIYGRAFDPAGQPLSPTTTLVPALSPELRLGDGPSVIAHSGNRYLLNWSEWSTVSGPRTVYVQLVQSPGLLTDGFEAGDASAWSASVP